MADRNEDTEVVTYKPGDAVEIRWKPGDHIWHPGVYQKHGVEPGDDRKWWPHHVTIEGTTYIFGDNEIRNPVTSTVATLPDIVERLRIREGMYGGYAIRQEAADAIERLRAENERLERGVTHYRNLCADMEPKHG